jgi:hypothetical protein
MLGFLEGRDGSKLRGFFVHFSGKQLGPSLGVGECLHQQRHPRGSSASLDICAILRLSLEQSYDSSIDQTSVAQLVWR